MLTALPHRQPAPDGAAALHSRRPVCPRCALPLPTCLCAWVRPTANRLPVLILQHPQEARQAKGSARLLQLSLAQCQREVGAQFDDVVLAAWLDTPSGASACLLLYPGEPGAARHATPPSAAPVTPRPDVARLVLLDGTWRQSRQLLRQHPRLQALPRWPLHQPPPSAYAIRRAHRPGQLSTLEAACLALAGLEGDAGRYAPLQAAFGGWVAARAADQPSAHRTALHERVSSRPDSDQRDSDQPDNAQPDGST